MSLTNFRRALLGMACLFVATAAQAQATRTWVSGVGDDANPCSRTAPCKTFAGAISKTAAGGIISVLDPGGFGAVTVTKSITIDGGGFDASILASGVTGVIINAADIVVTLRNLNINGAGVSPGINGVRFLNGRSLHIEKCVITGFRGTNGTGVLVDATAATGVMRVYITDSTLTENGSGSVEGGGIRIKQTGSWVSLNVARSEISNNHGHGIRVGDRTFGHITATQVNGNALSGVNVTTTAAASDLVVHDSVLSDNGLGTATDAGVYVTGTNSIVRLSGNLISESDRGIYRANFGKAYSSGDNRMFGNTSNGTVNGPDTSL